MPTIHEQLETLKATLAAILDGIERLELQLDPEHEANTEEFNAWCDAFDQRWADHKQLSLESDPCYNNHPAAWR